MTLHSGDASTGTPNWGKGIEVSLGYTGQLCLKNQIKCSFSTTPSPLIIIRQHPLWLSSSKWPTPMSHCHGKKISSEIKYLPFSHLQSKGHFSTPTPCKYIGIVKVSFLVNLTNPRSFEKKGSQLRNASIRNSYRQVFGDIFLVNSWCGRTQLTMGSAIPGKVFQGCLREQTEQAMGSQAVSRISPWSVLQFLSWFCFRMDCKL